jgi:hypothetical protein
MPMARASPAEGRAARASAGPGSLPLASASERRRVASRKVAAAIACGRPSRKTRAAASTRSPEPEGRSAKAGVGLHRKGAPSASRDGRTRIQSDRTTRHSKEVAADPGGGSTSVYEVSAKGRIARTAARTGGAGNDSCAGSSMQAAARGGRGGAWGSGAATVAAAGPGACSRGGGEGAGGSSAPRAAARAAPGGGSGGPSAVGWEGKDGAGLSVYICVQRRRGASRPGMPPL